MSPEIIVLTFTAATIAFVHTLLGPDHYLPFVAMARARDWTLAKTVRITLYCGVGHLLGSVILGVVGIALGTQLASLEWLEAIRGGLAAWLLIGFGLAYTVWGLRQAWRNKPHQHWHRHDGVSHSHQHTHKSQHAHVHSPVNAPAKKSITPWVIFVIFVLGPCEPLIPLLMYPAARESTLGVMLVAGVFGLVTVLTMTLAVATSMLGLDALKRPLRLVGFERYAHAVAGSTLLLCGVSVVLLGV
jgi:nickel/cobalt exporter